MYIRTLQHSQVSTLCTMGPNPFFKSYWNFYIGFWIGHFYRAVKFTSKFSLVKSLAKDRLISESFSRWLQYPPILSIFTLGG